MNPLTKAFDTLDHEILIKKLSKYSIRGIALKLLESYLKDRQQYVSLMNTTSNINNSSCGIPQGSVLVPLLFVLYINDLTNISNSFNPILLADDTNLIISDKSITD